MNFLIDWLFLADIFGMGFLLLGTLFTLISAIAMMRYPDLLSRQHVATKPQVFSLIMFLLGVILLVRTTAVTWTLLIVIAFQLVSAPISAHMLSRAGYRTGRVLQSELLFDELATDLRTGTDEYRIQKAAVEDLTANFSALSDAGKNSPRAVSAALYPEQSSVRTEKSEY
ncbi:monovalent cation/H(+) antiporter subunit G [Arcanobacterium hippocoleae]|uniref:Monovalent cation/proton antiporter MnhG/PhaG subunit n=1 Tax=Arcanobacterium hippocoleae TaxID=149017 RepID=A0ABU1T2Y1_9ACTO|nr:monovalent cation/H(+) antiporter subunit G [Arcanobacterium hippocoleae]MDR6939664.1 monovalent cation/proton antiporter MnhG/PhaG subunit [Arcanobacterium hippocoleae]